MLGSGGMPSSHSATVAALAVAIGLQEGTGGSLFALSAILASVVSTCILYIFDIILETWFLNPRTSPSLNQWLQKMWYSRSFV